MNNGNATLSITSIQIGGANAGGFSLNNNCDGSVAAGARCAIGVTFTPTGTGPLTGTVTITDNAADSPQKVKLWGTGLQRGSPGVALSATSLTFDPLSVGSSSPRQPVALTNYGNATLSITNIHIGGANDDAFGLNKTCGATVAAGASCAIGITFTPTAIGKLTGTVTITDNAANSPQVVSLAGTGLPASPFVTLEPGSLTFAAQPVRTTSGAQRVELTNTGNAPLTLTSIAAAGDFGLNNNCGASVAAGASCAISMTFTPTATGPLTGKVSITDSAPDSPQVVSLAGTGLPALPQPAATAEAPISISVSPPVVQPVNGKLPASIILAVSADPPCPTGVADLSNDSISLTGSGLTLGEPKIGPCTTTSTVTIDPNAPAGDHDVVLLDKNRLPRGRAKFSVLDITAGPIPPGLAPQVDVL